jgi:hypothetical protein
VDAAVAYCQECVVGLSHSNRIVAWLDPDERTMATGRRRRRRG